MFHIIYYYIYIRIVDNTCEYLIYTRNINKIYDFVRVYISLKIKIIIFFTVFSQIFLIPFVNLAYSALTCFKFGPASVERTSAVALGLNVE